MTLSAKSQWPDPIAEVVTSPASQSHVIIGAPGSGKTTLLIDRADYLVNSWNLHPDSVRFLTPTRVHATRLRDLVSKRLGRATRGPYARSVSSLAFSLVASDNIRRGLPAPTLRSGADIDDDIRALLEEGPTPFAGVFDNDVIATETFRTELRELMARVIEHGYTASDLERFGVSQNRVEWIRAADFMSSYQEAVARARPHSFDGAELIATACRIVGDGLPAEWEDLAAVLVDDVHDMPVSARRLLVALWQAGVSVAAVGDPDSAGQTFRGSNPEGPALLADLMGVQPIFLPEVYRHGPHIARVVSRLSARLGAARAGKQRLAQPVAPDGPLPISHLLSPSGTDEDNRIARLIAALVDGEGVSPDDIAVLSRRAGALGGLARALATFGIDSHSSTRQPLSSQAASRELLWWVQAALSPEAISQDQAHDMLTGLYGGWSALDVRRFTTWIRTVDRDAGVTRLASEAIRELVVGDDVYVDAPAGLASRIDRIRRIVGSVRSLGSDAPVHEVVGACWSAVGVEDVWRVEAQAGGEGARHASAHLDAVVALMETVARLESSPVSAAFFAARVLGQDVAEDVVVPDPLIPSVWLGTPSSAAGREWEVVILHGVNDGVWPNLRTRGSMLGAPLISSLDAGVDPDSIDQRRVVVDDEIRMAVLGASRAKSQLVVSAVDGPDQSPSPLFHLLTTSSTARGTDSDDGVTLGELVALNRRKLIASPSESAPECAGELAFLVRAGVSGADPATWWGVSSPTTIEPLFADTTPRLSPSKVGDVESSPLMWLLDTIAPEPLPPVVSAGALIHRALEEHPWGSVEELAAVVNRFWADIPFDSAWVSEARRAVALRQVSALADFLSDQDRDGLQLVGSEMRFVLSLGGADVSGVMDRVVQGDDGAYQVIDLKTGRHKTDSQVVDDPQLLAYQLAITTPGTVEGVAPDATSGGAFLLYVSSGVRGKTYRIARQSAMSDDARQAFLERLSLVADTVASHEFAVGEGDSPQPGSAPRHRWHLIGQVCGD